MSHWTSSILILGICMMSGFHSHVSAEPVTTGTIIEEMTDFDRLTDMPAQHYRTIQFTSYDRTSDVPGGPGWFNNSDGFGGERIPNFEEVLREPDSNGVGEYLICDVKGPGAIVRTWTAAINGNVRVYLDDMDNPIYDGPANTFFHRPYASFTKDTDLDGNVLYGTFYQRDASYCPMPFSERCRVVWTGQVRGRQSVHFYYIQLRQYTDENVEVQTFKPEDLKTYRSQIDHAMKVLKDPDKHLAAEGEKQSFDVEVAPGRRTKALEWEGEGAIQWLSVTVEAEDMIAALRQTVMHITFDGWPHGQVHSPVGDYFGAAPGINPYVSLPFTVQPDGKMISRYVMPYRKKANITFENLGKQQVKVTGEVVTADRKWDEERTMHFYARWRVNHDLTTVPPIDMPYIIANGEGRYVGTGLYMINPANGPHPSGSWWGEGDEKIFVDDDKMPSSFGTGSEDYFNYAWSAVDIFTYPYCAQPRNDGPANRGFVTNNRWHMIDDLPFKYRLSFYMELLSHHSVSGFSYARIGYHYGRPGKMDDHVAITPEDVRKPERPGPWKPLAYRGSRGATFFTPPDVVQGDVKLETEEDVFYSDNTLYIWKPKAADDTVSFKINVDKDGEYYVRVVTLRDKRSGKFSATLNGEAFGFGGRSGVENFYDPHRGTLQATGSRGIKLEKGEHTLEIKYIGPGNEEADPAQLGIDFLWLQPVGM